VLEANTQNPKQTVEKKRERLDLVKKRWEEGTRFKQGKSQSGSE